MSSSLWPTRLLCPWNFPGKNTGVGNKLPSPGDLPNQGIKPVSSALQADSLLLTHQGSSWEIWNKKHYKSISYFDKNAREALIEGRWNEPSISWNKIRGKKWWENVYLCSLIPFLTAAGISLKPAVPNVFGTSNWFYRRQFVHGWGGRMLQVVMRVMGSSRWTFSCQPATYLARWPGS